jgi:hypothetical protein
MARQNYHNTDYALHEIKSPSGEVLKIIADSVFHACDIAVRLENFRYSNSDYLKLNGCI